MDITIVPKDLPVFIDSGSPDSYLLANEFIDTLNDTFNSSYPTFIGNDTRNTTQLADEPVGEVILMAVLSLILGLMILVTVIGNVFVIAAIILERNLQNVANYLVASLAVADLLVACLVMPLGAVYEISRGWILGPELCDIWTSCDVLCCTASILHLVAIATDRYWAVTNVDYIHSRTSNRVFIMIFLVWFFAVIVSLAPQFGWKDPEYLQRIEQQKCMVSQDVAYQVFATCCTFYVPLFVILVLYWKIYQTARKRIRRRKPKSKLPVASNNNQDVPKPKQKLRLRIASKFKSSNQEKSAVSSLGLVEGNSTNTVNTFEEPDDSSNTCEKKNGTEVTAFNADEGTSSGDCQISTVSHHVENQTAAAAIESSNKNDTSSCSHHNQSNIAVAGMNQNNNQTLSTTTVATGATTMIGSQVSTPVHPQQPSSSSRGVPTSQVTKRKETLEAKRERKAAKTLAIITGAFVVCWLPFFILALLLPLCETCHINDWIASLFLWLGYFNSTLNPVIYTIFSPEFRQAFKRILCGSHSRSTYYRRGKL